MCRSLYLAERSCTRTFVCSLFFFNDTATTEIYTLSLHDALPISSLVQSGPRLERRGGAGGGIQGDSRLARRIDYARGSDCASPDTQPKFRQKANCLVPSSTRMSARYDRIDTDALEVQNERIKIRKRPPLEPRTHDARFGDISSPGGDRSRPYLPRAAGPGQHWPGGRQHAPPQRRAREPIPCQDSPRRRRLYPHRLRKH